MEVKGTIKRIGELKQITDTFKKVEFVLEIEKDTDYPQSIQFEIQQDKTENFLKYNKVGQEVEVSFNLRGRDWANKDGEVKTFNTLQAWKVFTVNNNGVAKQETTQEQEVAPVEDSEDLPF